MNPATHLITLAVLGTLAACSQQKPAEQAVAAATSALSAVDDEAVKFIPGEYEKVKVGLDRAREALKAGQHADAIAAAKEVPTQAATLAALAAEARSKYAETLKLEWERLNGSVPGMLTAIETRLSTPGGQAMLPKGMDRSRIDDASARLAIARRSWDSAAQKFAAGDLEQAVAHAKSTQTISMKLMIGLGLAPAEEPAAAVAGFSAGRWA
jgi:hypothetical protein